MDQIVKNLKRIYLSTNKLTKNYIEKNFKKRKGIVEKIFQILSTIISTGIFISIVGMIFCKVAINNIVAKKEEQLTKVQLVKNSN